MYNILCCVVFKTIKNIVVDTWRRFWRRFLGGNCLHYRPYSSANIISFIHEIYVTRTYLLIIQFHQIVRIHRYWWVPKRWPTAFLVSFIKYNILCLTHKIIIVFILICVLRSSCSIRTRLRRRKGKKIAFFFS